MPPDDGFPFRRGLSPLRTTLLAPLLLSGCDPGGHGSEPVADAPPVLRVEGLLPTIRSGLDSDFRIVALDPDGGRVSVELLTPRQGLTLEARGFQDSPAVVRGRWRWPIPFGEDDSLVLVVREENAPERAHRFVVPVRIEGGRSRSGLLRGDVSGDGKIDLVTIVGGRDVGFARDVGEILVFLDGGLGGGEPVARLTIPDAQDGDSLGNTSLVDLTGDGVLDVFDTSFEWSGQRGAAFLWPGGAALSGALEAPIVLAAPIEPGIGRLASKVVPDLDGDGQADVLAWNQTLTGSRLSKGFVWAGGALEPGAEPSATLVLPAGDTWARGGDTELLVDATGDGQVDVVRCLPAASVAGIGGSGGVLVYAGGASLHGAVEARARLVAPDARPNDGLGGGGREGVLAGDVTGDGVADLVVAAPRADSAALADRGALYLWSGGDSLAGTPAPLAVLRLEDARSALGRGGSGQGFELHDVNGDGTLDVVALSRDAIAIWNGGASLVGMPPPSELLTAPVAAADDLTQGGFADGLHFADLFGDGLPAVCAGTNRLDVDGVVDVGALYVWRTGAGLSSPRGPTTLLAIPSPTPGDGLGQIESALDGAIWLDDVSGDGRPDVVLGASAADVGGSLDTGAVWVWSALDPAEPRPPPSAVLTVPGRPARTNLGRIGGSRSGLVLHDLTGDGVLDVLAASTSAGGRGAILVWCGGAALAGEPAPWSTLASADAQALADGSGGASLWLADLTGDGRTDVLAAAPLGDFAGVFNSGGACLWNGADLAGAPAPLLTLLRPRSLPDDRLGVCGPGAFRPVDLDGDDRLDLVLSGGLADVETVVDAGVILVWRGPLEAGGAIPAELAHPEPRDEDHLAR